MNEMLPIVEIVRLEEGEQGTFGVLKINKEIFCVTLEPSDRENDIGKSSIPAQQYMCKAITTRNLGKTYQVLDVPGRIGIFFHKGNTAADTSGCILLAEHFGKLKTDKYERAILNSGNTFEAFLDLLEGCERFHLTIHEVY